MKTLFLWLFMVFLMSVYPFEMRTYIVPHADKALHFVLYTVTAMLFFTVLREKRPAVTRGGLLFASVVLSAGYGLLMEVAQGFLKTRDFSMWDMAANALGAAVGALFIDHAAGRKRRA